ncbi:helix-turn-helix transcriptional regulator [Nocardia sp. NPDC057227]|uniref:helix-turn-helix transcriptional regulator n=1 Tax=Nocardia sp. NPDC057227 TaxID=3346056 RepID=UPI003624B11E
MNTTRGSEANEPNRRYADPKLSRREAEVLVEWILADTKDQVARKLYLAIGTINTHLSRSRAKYDSVGRPANTKAQLLARVLQDGLLDLEKI